MLAAADTHWWYRGRRRVLAAELAALELEPGTPVLDAGCGGGQTLDLLAEYGQPAGVDPDPASVEQARARGHLAFEASLPVLPFADEQFGAATCLDVIEHLDDDTAALAELRRVVVSGGALIVTVPAFQALWSAHDEANEHRRRYRASTLKAVAARSGWRVERTTYFNALLLPPTAVVRFARRLRRADADDARSDLSLTPRSLDGALEMPLRAEAALLRHGARLPLGLSLLAVLRRP